MAEAADGTGKVVDLAGARTAKDVEQKLFNNGLPYERHRVVQMGKFHLEQIFTHAFEFGKCLVLLWENENRQTYADILEDHFGGMPERTARQYRRFVRFAERFPRFKDLFTRPRMVYKGMALLEGLKDPEIEAELAEFEATGQWGDLAASDLMEKSVRELKGENRRLRREREEAVARATRDLAAENEKLRGELEVLEAARERVQDLKAARRLIQAGASLIRKAAETLGRVDWRLVAEDEGTRQMAILERGAADRLAGYLDGVLFGGFPDDPERLG
jgi:hypothetical protein